MSIQTSEKAAETIGNRFNLVLIAAHRVRELNRGDAPKINLKDNNSVVALTEIERGLVGNEYLKKLKTHTKLAKPKFDRW